jgi:hypothetical protein
MSLQNDVTRLISMVSPSPVIRPIFFTSPHAGKRSLKYFLFLPLFATENHHSGQCLVFYRVFLANHLVIGSNLKNHMNIKTIEGKMGNNDRQTL